MAASKVAIARAPDQLDGRLDARRSRFDAHGVGEPPEDLGHLLRRRLRDADLVGNAAKVRLFEHRLRFKVRAEANRGAEWERDPLARGERHRIFAALEGSNPAI